MARPTAGGSGTRTTLVPLPHTRSTRWPCSSPRSAMSAPVASKIRKPSRPGMTTSAKSYGFGDCRAAVGRAPNCRWVNPGVGDSAGAEGRRTCSAGEWSRTRRGRGPVDSAVNREPPGRCVSSTSVVRDGSSWRWRRCSAHRPGGAGRCCRAGRRQASRSRSVNSSPEDVEARCRWVGGGAGPLVLGGGAAGMLAVGALVMRRSGSVVGSLLHLQWVV